MAARQVSSSARCVCADRTHSKSVGAGEAASGASYIAKDFDSGALPGRGLLTEPGIQWSEVMAEKTCAACDCKLDGASIKVRIGGKTVEVCCDECAQKLKEAHASTAAPRKG